MPQTKVWHICLLYFPFPCSGAGRQRRLVQDSVTMRAVLPGPDCPCHTGLFIGDRGHTTLLDTLQWLPFAPEKNLDLLQCLQVCGAGCPGSPHPRLIRRSSPPGLAPPTHPNLSHPPLPLSAGMVFFSFKPQPKCHLLRGRFPPTVVGCLSPVYFPSDPSLSPPRAP